MLMEFDPEHPPSMLQCHMFRNRTLCHAGHMMASTCLYLFYFEGSMGIDALDVASARCPPKLPLRFDSLHGNLAQAQINR
jgi:hypothetical protein